MEHHQATIEAYVERCQAVEDNLAVVVGGSVARGTERPDSDVDVYLVVTEEAFAAAVRDGRMAYVDRGVATYDGGYVDIKVVSPAYLDAAAERGDDPVRASFLGSRIAWSRLPDLAERLENVTRLPESAWAPRQASFLAQARLHGGYFLRQANQLDNAYLRQHAAVHLVNAAGRLLLARHRIFFAGPKYLTDQVAALDVIPDGFADAVANVLADPSAANGAALVDLIESTVQIDSTGQTAESREASLSTFVHDNELAWLHRTPPPEYF